MVSNNDMLAQLTPLAVEFVKIIPSILWFTMGVVALYVFFKPLRDDLIPHLSSIKAGGVELSFVREHFDAAIEVGKKSSEWEVKVSPAQKDRALNRAKRHYNVFRGTRMLWIDDHPDNNVNEQKMFCQLNVDIDIARGTEDALDTLRRGNYDLVVSDMARGNEALAGLEFLKRLRQQKGTVPVIFYIGVLDPDKGVPAGAFGLTNRPDELLHLVLDALERKRY